MFCMFCIGELVLYGGVSSVWGVSFVCSECSILGSYFCMGELVPYVLYWGVSSVWGS